MRHSRKSLIVLTERYALPTVFADREQAEAGGLISYGATRSEAYRQAGNYIGRIVNGESRVTCRSYYPPNSLCSSIVRPPSLSASPCHRRFSHAPTRSSNKYPHAPVVAVHEFGSGTSRHFGARQNLVAIGA